MPFVCRLILGRVSIKIRENFIWKWEDTYGTASCMTSPPSLPLLLLFGGSFNPPHNGHMRVLLEAAEALEPESILFVPCAAPPHKTNADLLPFAFRCALLRAALADLMHSAGEAPLPCAVSEAEGERDGPSFTIDTLRTFAALFPGLRPVFVMGTGDYSRLNTWKDWQELPEHADLAVLPRDAAGVDFFNSASLRFWPKARALAPPAPGVASAFSLPQGGRLLYVPQPRLEISSSLVRRRYRAGSSLDFLVPPGVLALLRQKRELVDSLWKQGES